jgi:glycosidase
MGTDEELRKLLATAHEHQINVILDYVANHMHINSPTLQAHPDWITDSILPDGRRNFELWDEARLTTWFDKHIPTLDLEREEVCDAMTDTALYWIENYDFDGYRHDACKHIPLNYWRMFTRKMKTRYPDRALWMIGETYGNSELIGSYVKSGMLNAQFDFNIYHTAIDVFGKEGQSMKSLANTINESLSAYGMHHTMGNISGNHDKTRFISLAGGAVHDNEMQRQKSGRSRGDALRSQCAHIGSSVLRKPVARNLPTGAAPLLATPPLCENSTPPHHRNR